MEEAQYIRGPADSARINLEEEHELVYWKTLLGVSETKLRVAVAFAGVMASDVRDYLGLPSAQGVADTRGLALLECPESCSSSEVKPALASRQSRPNVRSFVDFTRFSHVFERAR